MDQRLSRATSTYAMRAIIIDRRIDISSDQENDIKFEFI